MSVTDEIAAERLRQVQDEGWTLKHDDRHAEGELATAAACYAASKPLFVHEEREVQLNSSRGIDENCYFYDYGPVTAYYGAWPWDEDWDKRSSHPRRRQLVIAGALIVAEIERLDRLDAAEREDAARGGPLTQEKQP